MKALQWEKLTAEFYAYIGDQNMVSKAQLVRKWHNWKQYNKGVSIELIPTYREFATWAGKKISFHRIVLLILIFMDLVITTNYN